MPWIDELVDHLGKAKYISILDLARDYWQVPMAEKNWDITAFVTPYGLYQFMVMLFELQGAPATFQRMMDKFIRGHETFPAAYLDDLIVYSETFEEHLLHLRWVMVTLQADGLTANPKKCQFAMTQVCVPGTWGWRWNGWVGAIKGWSKSIISNTNNKKMCEIISWNYGLL